MTMVLLALALAQTPAASIQEARLALTAEPQECASGDEATQIRCLLMHRLMADPEASRLAIELYDTLGDLVTVLPEEDFEGGYRGVIHLMPQWPMASERKHLAFVSLALREIESLLVDTQRQSAAHIAFRARGLVLRFFRSVGRRTPAAFAVNWSVAYNTNGSLNGSLAQVRGLLFHELFHLNDAGWSRDALSQDYDAIVGRCGTRVACLTPYVPEALLVRVPGGTYYSFMPSNGVGEYAADLALRYFKEQTEVMAGRPLKRPFKCGPPENARAWAKLVAHFFAGVDRVPPCSDA